MNYARSKVLAEISILVIIVIIIIILFSCISSVISIIISILALLLLVIVVVVLLFLGVVHDIVLVGISNIITIISGSSIMFVRVIIYEQDKSLKLTFLFISGVLGVFLV